MDKTVVIRDGFGEGAPLDKTVVIRDGLVKGNPVDKTVVIGDGSGKENHSGRQEKALESPGQCPFCNEEFPDAPSADGSNCCPSCGYIYDPNTELKPGAVLKGKYRILKPLNAGGCGDIYLCHPLGDMKTRYVLKVLRDITTPDSQNRFEREARLLRMLTFPVIVQFIDHWVAFSGSYIILEYVEGSTLNDIINQYEIDEETTLRIALEVAKALRFAWEHGKIVHRDIKPSNIMINNEQEVRLLDFGIAKQTESDASATVTAINTALGTPSFMSPEQYKNAKNVDFRSDIYSLGVTMYFLLKKENPFSGKTFLDIYQDTLRNSPPPRSCFEGVCSDECVSLLQSMMELDPGKRPGSYDELIQSIERILSRFG